MRVAIAVVIALSCAVGTVGHAKEPSPSKEDAAEMLKAMRLLDQSFGLESMPKPHCLTWGYGHVITADEVKACAAKALEGQSLPGLGTKYVLATLMAEIGPQTVIAVSLTPPGW